MEFFAASFIEKEKDAHDMLALYYSDPIKWKEVLLLYLGLNKNKEYAGTILFWGKLFSKCFISMLRFSILGT